MAKILSPDRVTQVPAQDLPFADFIPAGALHSPCNLHPMMLRLFLLLAAFGAAQPLAAQPSRLHREVVGAGKHTVIVLHGGPGLRHEYLLPEWAPLGGSARMIFYDQRGCGQSTREGPYTWQQHLEDLSVLIGEVAPGQRVVLAGSSWGAWLALAYAASHPTQIEGVVLSGVTPWPRSGRADPRHQALPTAERARSDSLQAGLPVILRPALDSATTARTFSGANPVLAARLKEMCLEANRATLYSLSNGFPEVETLRAIQVPVLIVQGTREGAWQDGSGEIAAILPRVESVRIENAGHDPWFDQPGRFRSAVQHFLDRLPRDPPAN